MDPKNALQQIFHQFRDIPYENLSKIFRLTLPPEEALAQDRELFLNYYRNGWGGTCFSLSWAAIRLIREAGLKAYPIAAPMPRRHFPHYALIYSCDGKNYLFDPGYMVYEGVEADKETPAVYSNGVMDYELVYLRKRGHFALNSMQDGKRQQRYTFRTEAVSDRDFEAAWRRSFTYISQPVLSRVREGRFVYIAGEFAQMRSANTLERFESREKRDRLLEAWFPFKAEEIRLAEEILSKYPHKSGEDGDVLY